jgi:RNA polymerase sigma factor (TIGR02999 family)
MRPTETLATLPADLTRLLSGWRAGDRAAFDALLGTTYEELRRLARSHLRREGAANTLNATGLVHEAWLKLARQRHPRFENRDHFFGAASHTMRRVLVEHARARLAHKRHGERVPLTGVADVLGTTPSLHDLLSVDAALDGLGTIDPRLVRVVECRYFAGLTIPETAAALGISHTTVSNDWRFARAWLHHTISGQPGPPAIGRGGVAA